MTIDIERGDILATKMEKKKIYYTTDVITDVLCDNCGKSLIGDDDFVYKVQIDSLYYVKDKQFLGGSDFSDHCVYLCEDCIKPIKELVRKIDNKI